MRDNSNTIKHQNYKEQLEWFNISVKPVLVGQYQKKFKPIALTLPSLPSTTNNSSLPHSYDFSTPEQSHNLSSNGTHNVQDRPYTTDAQSPSASDHLFGKETTYATVSTNNRESPNTMGRKRAIGQDSNDAIDLTDSQPKRSKVQGFSQPPLNTTAIDPNLKELHQAFEDDAFDDFGDDYFEQTDMMDDDLSMFYSIDDDMMMNLDDISTSPSLPMIESTESTLEGQSKHDLEMILSALKSEQLEVSDRIVEGLSNNGTPEQQKKLLDERKDLVDRIQKIQDLIDNYGNQTHNQRDNQNDKQTPDIQNEESDLIVLDDEDVQSMEVSPFFSSNVSRPTVTANIIPTIPPPAPIPPTVPVQSVQPTYEWSRDVRKALVQNFKLSEFRPNQLEAINTTLKGEDVFVLMPTGGGKSLCYQLPAIIQRYNRQGVTFVVSPLLSLMQDQVEQLVEGKGIAAGMLNSTVPVAQKRWVFNDLYKPTPTMQLLYITPELLSKSDQLKNALDALYKRNKLARIVIDEAHCVSQWGHDFRPDYKLLGYLKDQYPSVPIMALTATANESVQKDVLYNLKIKDCKVLKQSFNRNNLVYQVVSKTKSMFPEIKDFIRGHPGRSGIIYCCTRKDCELVAEKLSTGFGISIKHYHAAMTSAERSEVQREWQTGKIQVIAATIAFGMGIDKPDVRFVIHYSMPSSLEGYYQETGRAGRDGLPATCRMYYSFGDTKTHSFLIDQGDGNWEQKQRQRQNLNTMIRFCENETDCRRKQIMGYFGERFEAALCQKMCDNCLRNQHTQSIMRDMSKDAIVLVKSLREMEPNRVTMVQLVDIYRGSRNKRIMENGYDELQVYGYGKSKTKIDADRLLRSMVAEDVIREKSECNARGFPISYIYLSTKADSLLNGSHKILISYTQSSSSTAPPPRINNASRQTNGASSSLQRFAAPSSMNGFIPAGSIENENMLPTQNNRRTFPTASASTPGRRVLPSTNTNASNAASRIPEDKNVQNCYLEMQKIRQQLMAKYNIRQPGSILTDTALKNIAKKLPLNEREFSLVSNMKEGLYGKYGEPFLRISVKYDSIKRQMNAS